METVFANNTTGTNPMSAGWNSLFSPNAGVSDVMGKVAEGLNNPAAATESLEEGGTAVKTPTFLESIGKKEKEFSITDAFKEAEANGEVETPEEGQEIDVRKTTRSKTDKNLAIDYIADRAKEGKVALFSDYTEETPIEDYLSKMPKERFYELLDKNIEDARTSAIAEVEESAAQQHYESLPPQYRAMYEYAVNGGNNWEQFAQSLNSYQSVLQLDPSNEDHQPAIVKNYLEAVGFGNPQMIQKQVQEWSNDGKIGDKASEFKEPLVSMYAQQQQQLVQQQQEYARQQQQEAHEYITSVANTLRKGEIDGIKLDKKLQQALYQGLTIADKESINGGYTNRLEHLWEKINYVDRDYNKITKLLWFMEDEAGFMKAHGQQIKNEAANETFNELKRLNVKNTGASNIVETAADKKKVRTMGPSLHGLFQ
jgi:hypothetical protein